MSKWVAILMVLGTLGVVGYLIVSKKPVSMNLSTTSSNSGGVEETAKDGGVTSESLNTELKDIDTETREMDVEFEELKNDAAGL